LEVVPITRTWTGNTRQLGHAFSVEAGDGHIEGVADLHGQVACGILEIGSVDNAFRLRAMINKNRIAGYADYRSLDAL
jgi:hypothetical protein